MPQPTMSMKSTTLRVAIVGAIWLALATAMGASGMLARIPFPPIFVPALIAALLIALWRSPSFRAWTWAVDLRFILLLHVARLVGLWFLVLHRRGELPWAFAVPGGSGDTVAAITVVPIALLCVPANSAAKRGALLAWNAFGLVDLLMVVATAAQFALWDIAQIAPLTRLPLALLPLFLVPLLIVTHLVVFARVRAVA
jgi:hypothetical protein